MGQVQQDMIDALRERVKDQERELARLTGILSSPMVTVASPIEGIQTLSRRDEFAKAAMQGVLSNSNTLDDNGDDIVLGSCMIADMMIAALDGEGDDD